MEQIEIYTDGACSGNPGPGGIGVIWKYGNKIKEYSKGYNNTTNNRMEITAAIVALESLTRPCEVTLYSDSKYLVDAFNQKWIDKWVANGWRSAGRKDVKNVDLWERLIKATEKHKVHFVWVKGHDSNPLNNKCDYLATTAAITKQQ